MILAFVIKDIILRLNNFVFVNKKTESDWNIKTNWKILCQLLLKIKPDLKFNWKLILLKKQVDR